MVGVGVGAPGERSRHDEDHPATLRLTARSPEDVLAAVPLVLGFMPEESVVMLTFGARAPLPRAARPATQRARAPGRCGGPGRPRRSGTGSDRCSSCLYAADAALARACARALVRAFARRGVAVVDVLRSDGRCWFVVPLDLTGLRVGGHALRRDRPPLHRSVRRRREGDPVLPRRAGGERRPRSSGGRPRRRGCSARARAGRSPARPRLGARHPGPVGCRGRPARPGHRRPAARCAARPRGEGRGPRLG